jgi:DnaJ family protein C protein 7
VAPAIKHLQEAMRNDPDNSLYRTEIKKWRSMEAQKDAGNDFFKKGKLAEAIEAWSGCLAIDPNHRSYNAKLHLNCGTAKAKLRRHEEAVVDCTKVGWTRQE